MQRFDEPQFCHPCSIISQLRSETCRLSSLYPSLIDLIAEIIEREWECVVLEPVMFSKVELAIDTVIFVKSLHVCAQFSALNTFHLFESA